MPKPAPTVPNDGSRVCEIPRLRSRLGSAQKSLSVEDLISEKEVHEVRIKSILYQIVSSRESTSNDNFKYVIQAANSIGITNSAIAKELDVSEAAVGRWATGANKPHSLLREHVREFVSSRYQRPD